jgi:hypothetical protein
VSWRGRGTVAAPALSCDDSPSQRDHHGAYNSVVLVCWIVIGSAPILATGALWLLWNSSDRAEHEWSVAGALLAFEAPFVVAFGPYGPGGVFYGMAAGVALGSMPIYFVGCVLAEWRRKHGRGLLDTNMTSPAEIMCRFGVTLGVQFVILMFWAGKPWGVLAGLIGLGALWKLRDPKVRRGLAEELDRASHAVSLTIAATTPFTGTGLLIAMPHPPIRWSSWAHSALAPLSYDSIWVVGAVVFMIVFTFRDEAERRVRSYLLAAVAPLAIVLLAVGLVPEIKSTPELATPVAILLSIATVSAIFSLTAAALYRGSSPASSAR